LSSYKAVLFDLDDTLLSREKAVDKMFLLVLEKCYEKVPHSVKHAMAQKFKECDRESFGYNDKTKVLESFFRAFPPKYKLPHHRIQDFWNINFPHCFSIDQNTIEIVNTIKMQAKVAIVTNGLTQRQKAKITNTKLNSYFDTILISDEVGFRKPDNRIFESALNRLHVQPEETLFVGDDLEKDIAGCQNVNMKGIWFNPHMIKNDTKIKPYAEIHSFDRLLSFFVS
jgi:putative hydrolase of the HAD superfamily